MRFTRILFSLLLCSAISLTACSSIRPSFISENSFKTDSQDTELGGHFEGEEWIPDNASIPMTYKLPDISGGYLFDFVDYTSTPCLQVELLEIDTHIPWIGTFKIDAGVAYQRAYFYIGKLWTSIFEISTGIWCGWAWGDGELAYGIGISIIEF